MKRFVTLILASLMLLCGCAADPSGVPDNTPENTPENTQEASHHEHTGYVIAAPAPHEYAADPNSIVSEDGAVDHEKYNSMYEEWVKQLNARREEAKSAPDLRAFTEGLLTELMTQAEDNNLVFSPANIFVALAMLAETAEGETRREILSLLGAGDMESLRKAASALIKAEPVDDGVTKCTVANSLWLNDRYSFVTETLERLADIYDASSFWGDPCDGDFVQALRDWLNDNTGGLLKDAVDSVELEPSTVLAIASTIYFKAAWENEYNKNATSPMTFHAPTGDIECDFMHKSVHGGYFRGEGFSALGDALKGSAGTMWYLLPDDGVSVEEMLKGSGMEFIFSDKSGANSSVIVNVSAPKIDVSADTDLVDALKSMGMRSCFVPEAAEFDPITTDAGELFVTEIKHAARVKTDEDGVEAAAFTLIKVYGNGAILPQEIVDFVLDRPFAFVITGISGAPLFVGIVNTPAE